MKSYRFSVRVNPNSSRQSLVWKGDWIKVNLQSPPEKGRANEELVELILEQFPVEKVEISQGETSRQKEIIVQVDDETLFLNTIRNMKG